MGVHPFEDLPKVMDERTKETVRLVTGIAQEAARQAGFYAAFGTPVDSGVARSNWIASLNNRTELVIPAYAPGTKLGQAEGANLQAVMEQHERVAAGFDAAKDSSIHITNSVDYIGLLNETDHSPQADPGFFDRAIGYAVSKIRGKWRLKP